MKTSQHVTGVARDDPNRSETDFYSTPSWATEALLAKEKLKYHVLEPACGAGAMSRVFEGKGYTVLSRDLYDHGYGETGKDFLEERNYQPCIVTNPPYKLALPFINHALTLTKPFEGQVAMLLRLQFLEGQKRKELFLSTPLRTVYVFSKRLSMSRDDLHDDPKGMIAFAWYVWDHKYEGKPYLDWI